MRQFPKPPNPSIAPSETPPSTDLKATIEPEEISFIYRTTLKTEHREDPHVLAYIAAYIRCRDNRQASREAGIHPQTGLALRRRMDISEAIAKITELSSLKYGIDAEEVVTKVKEVMDVDPGELYRSDGSFVESLNELSPEVRRAIKKFKAKNLYETDPNGMRICIGKLIEVEFWDKLKSAEMLGREKNLFKETKRIEHDVTTNMKDLLLESKERAEAKALEARGEKPLEIEYKDVTNE